MTLPENHRWLRPGERIRAGDVIVLATRWVAASPAMIGFKTNLLETWAAAIKRKSV